MNVNIYIASSIRGPGRRNGVVGFVLEAEGMEGHTVTQFGSVQDASADRAQLLALKYALKRIRDKNNLTVWTENAYIAAAFRQDWISGWVQREWKNCKGKEVANRAEWESVLEGNVPQFRTGEEHSFDAWLKREVGRRAKKYV